MSLDGYVAPADKKSTISPQDHGVFETAVADLIKSADSLMLGKPLADDLLNYWLNAEQNDPKLPANQIAYARWATKAHKYILSSKKTELPWPDAELLIAKDDKDFIKAIKQLKSRPGKNIVVHGGIRTAHTLSRLDLIDEYQLVVPPVALGAGFPLFEDISKPMTLELLESKQLKKSALFLRYHPLNT